MSDEIHWLHDLDDFNEQVITSRELIKQIWELEQSGKTINRKELQDNKEFLMERVTQVAKYLLSAYTIKEKP